MITFLIILASIFCFLLVLAIIAIIFLCNAFGKTLQGLATGFGAPNLMNKKPLDK
jgi:TM2 domain-containing membrane protein YozV